MNVLTSWKTTLTAILTGLAVILKSLLGIDIPTDAILAVAVFVIGLLAKDANKTGVA